MGGGSPEELSEGVKGRETKHRGDCVGKGRQDVVCNRQRHEGGVDCPSSGILVQVG